MTLIEKFNTKLSNIMKTPELRDRIVFTLLIFLVARIGTQIPVPGIDMDKFRETFKSNGLLDYVNLISGGGLERFSIFALGIIPYINASIVFSLLGSIIPRIEEIQKEGEGGRAKLTQWTRYLTIALAIVQSFGAATFLVSMGFVNSPGVMFYLVTMTLLVAGTVFLMWLGEQISLRGIGNGVSLLIFLGIISRIPTGIREAVKSIQNEKFLIPGLFLIGLAGVLVIMGIVAFQLGERKIPIHYVGKGFSGKGGMGQNSYIPLKLNTSGVMPIIFAQVLMSIFNVVARVMPKTTPIATKIANMFNGKSPVYLTLLALIIIFFSFFYTAIVFDPEKVADNLKQSGGTIPGIRPGSETVDYLEGVVTRITWGGALFLAGISVLPQIIFSAFDMQPLFGGTGIIIVVGVAIDTIQQINAHLVMREYKGFM